MKKGYRILLILLLGCLIPVMGLRAQETDAGTPAPELTVFYHEYSRKNITSSPDHMGEKIYAISPEDSSPDSELFVRDRTRLLVQLETTDFDVERCQVLIYEEDYRTGEKQEVTKEYYRQEAWRKEGESLYYLSLDFSKEGHFQLVISYSDAMGQSLQPGDQEKEAACFENGIYYGPHYTVDKTDPVLREGKAINSPSQKIGDLDCFSTLPSYEIVISEENFSPQYVHWMGNTDDIHLSSWETYYEDGIRKNRVILTAQKEGRYEIMWECKDGSGRMTTGGRCSFLVDDTAPGITVSVKGEDILKYSYDDVGIFSKSPITFLIEATDAVSGIRKISYSYPDINGEIREITNENKNNSERFALEVVLPLKDFCGSVTVKATDFMGKESESVKSPVCLWESTGTSQSDNQLKISLTDPVYTDTLHHIKYYKKAPTVSMTAISSRAGIRDSFLGYQFEGRTVKEEKDYHLSKKISYDMSQILKLATEDFVRSCRQNPINISGGFTDNAGYDILKDMEEYSLVVDSTAPKISVTFSDNTKQECYARSRTAMVTVRDPNFDMSSVSWHITGPKDGYSVGKWYKKGEKYCCKVDFSKDGSYHLAVSVRDYSGNEEDWEEKGSFSIDKTAPKLIILMDRSDVKHEKYYSTKKKIYLCVADKNLSLEGVHLYNGSKEISLKKDSLDKVSRNYFGFKNVSLWKIYSAEMTTEGSYHLSAVCEDMAGNQSETVRLSSFVIDLTKPDISWSHLNDNISYTDKVNPEIRIKDSHLMANETGLSLFYEDGQRALSLEKYFSRSENHRGDNVQYQCEDFSRDKKLDNHYILKITCCDLAGNKRTEKIHFCVDRFGTRYEIDEETKALLDKFYLKEEAEIAVTAYSLHPQDTEIAITYNNEEVRTLEASEYERECRILDETTQKLSGNILPERYKGWYCTTYRILKTSFKEEGDYQILLRSREKISGADENILTESENTLWTDPLHIAIDRTPPSVHIGGLEEKSYDADSVDYTVSAMDNTRLKKLKIYVRKAGDSRIFSYELYTEKDFDEEHSIHAKIDAYAGYQFVGYEAWDYAGNHVSSQDDGEEVKILVTPSKLVRIYYDHPFRLTALLLAVLFLTGTAILLTKKVFFDIV